MHLTLLSTLLGVLLLTTPRAAAGNIVPAQMQPVIPSGYVATDPDERGLWQSFDKFERELAASNLLVHDAHLQSYIEGIIVRLLGDDAAADVRLYIVRNPEFNASMAPNGLMIVHTGLLARMHNEAQLAAVLGHEAGHYFRRHSLARWRDIKTKAAIMSVISIGGAAATGATGNNWYDLANAINSSMLLTIFSYNRVQEQEADAFGVRLLAEAGYSPHAAASVWRQYIDERKASAEDRDKRYRDRSRSAVSTHPPTAERMDDLDAWATDLVATAAQDTTYERGELSWQAGLGELRWELLEEQIKLNDSGASLYLINSLAEDGWNSGYYYYLGRAYSLRGQVGDDERATQAYASAVEYADALPEAFRAHGYAQIKTGNAEIGKEALKTYLTLRPNAPDAAMVRFSAQQ